MAQASAVDYGIGLAGPHVDLFQGAPFIDAPFLFRDLDHWNKCSTRICSSDRRRDRQESRGDADRLPQAAARATSSLTAGAQPGRDERPKVRVQGAPI